jgi:FkbM family methyltransferase
MNRVRKILLALLGEKRYLSLLAHSFQYLYPTGLLGSGYQDIYFLKSIIREGDYCVDIGAHLGYYTLELSRLVKGRGMVLSIEPMSKFYDALRNLVKKRHIANVRLHQAAMGGEGQWVEMGVPEINRSKKFAYARVIRSNPYLQYIETENVRNENGDQLFADLPRLDFVKCDVEGLEVSVLSGMINTVYRHRPILLCELADKNERARLYEMLAPLGYEVFFLQDKSLHKMDVFSDLDTISHNHYFIPQASQERLRHLVAY